jgi:hypothetical protein
MKLINTIFSFSIISLSLGTLNAVFASPITVGGQYGLVFTDPSELNTVVDIFNDTFGSSAKRIGTAARFGLFSEYELNDSWSVGIGYQRMSPWTQATVGSSSGKYETETSLFGFRARHSFYRDGKLSAFVLPTIGLASYSLVGTISTGGTTQIVNTSASGLFVGIGVGGKIQFNDTVGISIDTGYQYAKSGALTIDSQANTGLATGGDYIVAGNRVKLDSSGVYVNLAVEFSFQGDKTSAAN